MAELAAVVSDVEKKEEKFFIDKEEVDKETLNEMKRRRDIRLIQESPISFRTLHRFVE